MLVQIAYFSILGIPLIGWGGIISFLMFIFSAYVGWRNAKGVNKPPLITYNAHIILAIIALILGLIHGLWGLLIYLL